MTDSASIYQQLREKVAVAPLNEVLSLLLLLANDVQNNDLAIWTQLELLGYFATNPVMTESTVLPEYRAVTGQWCYANGAPLVVDDPEVTNLINHFRLRNPVAELEELSRQNSVHSIIDHNFPPLIRRSLNVDVTFFRFHSREVAGVLSQIRTRAIGWLNGIRIQVPKPEPSMKTEIPSVSMPTQSARPTVFYSWQSDLPNSTNRGFIEECLNRAVKQLKAESELSVDPCIDRDTQGVPGSPDIVATIFEKIESCSLFVCDVSIINSGAKERPTPNPNVLVELGYAIKTLSWSRVICVFNETTGRIEDLPFDFRHRSMRRYKLENGESKAEQRTLLTNLLKAALQITFDFVAESSSVTPTGDQVETQTTLPRLEILDATLECQPPLIRPKDGSTHHIRPEFSQDGTILWTVTATVFINARSGVNLSVALHRCVGYFDDPYQGQKIQLRDLTIQSGPQSQVKVDDAVLQIRGPGKVTIQGTCETPFRNSFPDVAKLSFQLPVAELDEHPLQLNLELQPAKHTGQWPIRWRQQQTGE